MTERLVINERLCTESVSTVKLLGREALVMSFNINGQDSWYPDEPLKKWKTRAPLVRQVIDTHRPDIIGWQEFGVTSFADSFGRKDEYLEFYNGEKVGETFVNPIAWNTDRYRAHDKKTFWLSPDGRKEKAWGGILRGASAVLVEDIKTSEHTWVYNVHLDNISAVGRINGMDKVMRDIYDTTDDLPVIITGDFNTTSPPLPGKEGVYVDDLQARVVSDKKVYEITQENGFVDTAMVIDHAKQIDNPTFHAYLGDEIYELPDKYGVWHPDHILVRGLGVAAFKIIQDHSHGLYPSDHYPITASLKSLQSS